MPEIKEGETILIPWRVTGKWKDGRVTLEWGGYNYPITVSARVLEDLERAPKKPR